MRRVLPCVVVILGLAFAAENAHAIGGDESPRAKADPEFAAGKKALEKEDWAGAIEHFSRAADRNADVENYLGFAHRKRGEYELAFKHYDKALELDPRHRGAHEYMGEAYLLTGNPAKAEEHLSALNKLCLLPCGEYTELKAKLAAYKANR